MILPLFFENNYLIMATDLLTIISRSENTSVTNFQSVIDNCTNPGFFSSSDAMKIMSNWEGYYYKNGSGTRYGSWSYSYNHYSSASRSRTVTTYDTYTNGSEVQTGSSTQTENASVSYGGWTYNWTTTGNSTRSRTVTYSWSDYSSSATQTETGGTRYIVLDSFSDGVAEGGTHSFGAAGGSITARTISHDYWGSIHITTNVITGVSTSCSGFTCSVSGSTVTISASSKGTTESAANSATIVSTKSGFQSRHYGTCSQAANVRTLSSVYFVPYKPDASWIVDVTNGQWATCPASGGYVKAYGYANYTHTSGAPLNDQYITSNASLTWSTGYNSWITDHSNGGYHIASRGGSTGDARSSNATWTYGGKTSGAKTLTQQANSVISTSTEYGTATLNFSANVTSVGYGGGTSTLSYSASRPYRYKYTWTSTDNSYSGWATETGSVSISGSATGFSLSGTTVTISANPNTSSRSVTYTASCFGLTKTVTITQAGKPSSITVDATDFYFSIHNGNNTSMDATILETSSSSFSDAGSPYGISIDAYIWNYDQNVNVDGWMNGSLAFSGFNDDQFSNGNCKVFKLQMTDTLNGYTYMEYLSVNLEIRNSSGSTIVSHTSLDYSSFGGAATVEIPIVVCCDNSVSEIQISNYNFSDYYTTYSNPKAIVIRVPFNVYAGSYLQIAGDISFGINA